MAFKTLNELTQEVVSNVGLVSGTSVQTYTEPQIKLQIQNIFDFLFRKRTWDHLSDVYTWALDGSTGVVTTDLTSIVKDFRHIAAIHRSDDDKDVVRSFDRRHLRVEGTKALFWRPLQSQDAQFLTRVFKVYPVAAAGNIDVTVKIKPDDFNDSDQVPFPRDLIVYGASWLLLDTDGINPTNAAKCQTMFEQTYSDIIAEEGTAPIGQGTRGRTGDFTVQTLS